MSNITAYIRGLIEVVRFCVAKFSIFEFKFLQLQIISWKIKKHIYFHNVFAIDFYFYKI